MKTRFFFFAAVIQTLATAAAALYLSTERGHRSMADAIEYAVSDAIPGRVTIGRLESYGALAPVLRDVRFIHPNGRTVLRLDRVAIDLDLAAALRGRLAFHHAETSGGEILLSADPDGRTSIEATFDSPVPGTGKAEDGFHYRLRRMHVQDLTVTIRVAKDEFVHILGARGFVSVTRETTPGVNVRIDHLSGHIDRNLLGAPVSLLRADGDITGKEKQVVDLRLALRVGEEHLNAHARLFDRKQTPVELELKNDGGVKTTLASLGLKLGSSFTDSVHVVTD